MLAIVGLIVPEFVRVPGEIFQDVSVLDAHDVMVSFEPSLVLSKHCSERIGLNYW